MTGSPPDAPADPNAARGPGAVRWSRWRGETAERFVERVLADAARLGVVPRFLREQRGDFQDS